jgi:transposase, IS30 family
MAKHLTREQRYYICLEIAREVTQANIARVLNVDRSTVSREIKRNQRGKNDYDSDCAHKKSSLRRHQASIDKAFNKFTNRIKKYIIDKL